jgi:hypothetical protein
LNLTFVQDRRTRSVDHEGVSAASGGRNGFAELKDFLNTADQDSEDDTKWGSENRCLHEMLEESQTDSPVSFYSRLDSTEESDTEVK